jgi:hypothetical protein
MSLPQLAGLRRLLLFTDGAEELYRTHAGFKIPEQGLYPDLGEGKVKGKLTASRCQGNLYGDCSDCGRALWRGSGR